MASSPFSVDAAFTDSVAALEWVEQRALTSIASPSSDWTARVGYLQRRRSAGASRGDAYVRWRTSLLGERYARKRGAVEERLFTSYAEKQLLAAQAAEYAARHEHSLELESPSSSSSSPPPPPPRGGLHSLFAATTTKANIVAPAADDDDAALNLRASDVLLIDGSPVLAIGFAPRSAVFAAACESGIVVLCSLARDPLAPHIIARLDGHTRGVRSVAWDASGAWLLTSSDDDTIRLWSVQEAIAEAHIEANTALARLRFSSAALTRRAVRTVSAARVLHRQRPCFCRFHPRDSRIAVVCVERGVVELVDLRDSRPGCSVATTTLRAPDDDDSNLMHCHNIAACAFGASEGDDTDLFVASADGAVRCVRVRCPAGRPLAAAELTELEINLSAVDAALEQARPKVTPDRPTATRLSCVPLEQAAATAHARRQHADRLASDALLLVEAGGVVVLVRLSAVEDFAAAVVVTTGGAATCSAAATLVRCGDDYAVATMTRPGELVLAKVCLDAKDGSVALREGESGRRERPAGGGAVNAPAAEAGVVVAMLATNAACTTLIAANSDGCIIVLRRLERYAWQADGIGAPSASAVRRAVAGFNANPLAVAEALGAAEGEQRLLAPGANALAAFLLHARYGGVHARAVGLLCRARPDVCDALVAAAPLSGISMPLALDHLDRTIDLQHFEEKRELRRVLAHFVATYYELNSARVQTLAPDVALALCAHRIALARWEAEGAAVASASRPSLRDASDGELLTPHLVAIFSNSHTY